MSGLSYSRDAIVPVRRATLSANSARRRKMPRWIVPVREISCEQTGIIAGFLSSFVSLVLFSEFLVWFRFIWNISAFKSFILKS